jgi:hypothetical protein
LTPSLFYLHGDKGKQDEPGNKCLFLGGWFL